jgi:hypothetical protein
MAALAQDRQRLLRNQVQGNKPLTVAIVGANKRLDAKGLVAFDPQRPIAFDPHDPAERRKAVALTIGVSLDLLSPPERERFGQLGIFPEGADIPVGVVARFWAAAGGLRISKQKTFWVGFSISRYCSNVTSRRVWVSSGCTT